MIELIKDVFKTSNTRIKNPVLSSLIISFIFYNWKAISILLFAKCDIESKIYHIETYYSSYKSILIPTLISILYIVLLPYLNNLFDFILLPSKNKKNEFLKSSIIEDLKIQKEKAKYEREIAEEKAGTSEINNLKEQLNSLTEEKNKINELLKNSYNEKNDWLEANKKLIKDYENKISIKDYFMPSAIRKVYSQLKEYEKETLIKFYRYFKLNEDVDVAKNLLNDELKIKFRSLNLIELKEKFLTLTQFGEAVSESIIKQNE